MRLPPSPPPRHFTSLWVHAFAAVRYAWRFGGVAMMLAWSAAYFALAIQGSSDALAASAKTAAGFGALVGALFLAVQLRHIRDATRSAPMWAIFRNGTQVGYIDNASLAEMRLIALRNADNLWGQVAVILRCLMWVGRAWLTRVPAAAFWVVIITGLIDRESFFRLALAMHPDALDVNVIAVFSLAAVAMAAAIALWGELRLRSDPPWGSCYRADLQRMLHDHCGTPTQRGDWVVVAERALGEDSLFPRTIGEPLRV
jgi:hypothetical protein